MGGERTEWSQVRLSELLQLSREPGTNGAIAKKITVRVRGRGVIANTDTSPGSEATTYFCRRAGQLIYSKLDFLNGAFGIIPDELDGYESTADMPTFDILPGAEPSWLLAYLSRPAFFGRYKGGAVGSRKAQRVNVPEFLASKVGCPSPREQRAIAASLEPATGMIEHGERLIERVTAQKRAVMARLLLGLDAAGARPMKPLAERWIFGRVAEGVERIPADWELVRLTSVAKLESGHTPSRKEPSWWNGEIPWISLQDASRMDGLAISETTENISSLGIENSSARILPKETVVLIRTGASLGKACLMGRPMATSQGFANFVCRSKLNARYLLQVFRSLTREWRRLEAGSAIHDIYMPVFERLQILLPPLEEQRRLADIGEAFDQRIAAERAHLDALAVLKRGLADALLSGRVRLPAHLIASLAGGDAHVGS